MEAAKNYADNLAESLTKITMTEFFQKIHSQFYSEYDISFMQYFLDLTQQEGQFVVHHSKLLEYGIMTSTESSKIREKLTNLGMVKDTDYRLADIREPVKQGGFSKSKHYHLTPDAFKKCLMRAKRHGNQPVDPVIYCDYYLLLEKVHKLYTDYELAYSMKLLSMKDDKIDRLEHTLKEQAESHKKELADAIAAMREDADRQRAEILNETKEAHNETKKARQDINDLHNTVIRNHAQMIEAAQHSSVDVPASKRQYFAMTSYRQVGDDSGKLYFRLYRAQLDNMKKPLLTNLSSKSKDKDGNEYTAHNLVIPPIYCPGSVNIPVAASAKMKAFLVDKLEEFNEEMEEELSFKGFCKNIGITIGNIHAAWTPNNFIDHGQFVDFYFDEIKNTKIVRLSVDNPNLQAKLDKQANEQYQILINQTGESRENLMQIIEKARMAISDAN